MDHATIDFLFLARYAEAANGLLNVVGGAVTQLHRAMPPDRSVSLCHFGIAASVSVPWNETNKTHQLAIYVANEDETVAIVDTGIHHITVGRAPNAVPGITQHAVFGMTVDLIFSEPGGYCVVARLNSDDDVRKWPFQVHDVHPNIFLPME